MLKALSGCSGCTVAFSDPICGDVAAPFTGCARLAADSGIRIRSDASFNVILSKSSRRVHLLPAQAATPVTGVFVSPPRSQLSLPFMSPHPPILLGTISMVDSLILMVMALVVFGPRRLPQIGRQIGKLMYEFRKASNDFKFQMEEELRQSEEADRRKKEEERQRLLAAQAATEQASVSADPPAASTPEESPGPNEITYPEQYPPDTAPTESNAEETAPRIMPPSVGETIAAPRPNRAYGSAEESSDITVAPTTLEQPAETTSTLPDPTSSQAAEALNPHG
jgi:sec-independent protein translocase protein TatB